MKISIKSKKYLFCEFVDEDSGTAYYSSGTADEISFYILFLKAASIIRDE